MHRATKLVQESILRNGLSSEWGKAAVPSGMRIEDYINNLSEEDQSLLRKITDRWLIEGETLAREALLVNSDKLFLRMGQEIAEKGYLNKDDILGLYEENGVLTERSGSDFDNAVNAVNEVLATVDAGLERSGEKFGQNFNAKSFDMDSAAEAYNFLAKKAGGVLGFLSFTKWSKLSDLQRVAVSSYISGKVRDKSRDARISGKFWMPESVANITRIIEKEKAEATEPVTDISKFKIAGSLMCSKIL